MSQRMAHRVSLQKHSDYYTARAICERRGISTSDDDVGNDWKTLAPVYAKIETFDLQIHLIACSIYLVFWKYEKALIIHRKSSP